MNRVYFTFLFLSCVWPGASFTHWSVLPNRRSTLQQRKLLIRDVDICVRSSRVISVIDTLRSQLECVMIHLAHCVTALADDSEQRNSLRCEQCNYCGFVAMGGRSYRSFTKIYHVTGLYRHIILLDFIKFDFEWSPNDCNTYGVSLSHYPRHNITLFCGKRMPWTMISQKSEITLQIRVAKYIEYELILFYSSVHPDWTGHVSQLLSEYFTYVRAVNKISKGPWNLLHKLHRYEYFFLVTPWQRISVTLSRTHSSRPTEQLRLEVYDGPGPLSFYLFQQSEFNTNQSGMTSAFSTVVRLTLTHYEKVNDVFIILKAVNTTSQYEECGSWKNLKLSSLGLKNKICKLSPKIQIHHHDTKFNNSYPEFFIRKYIHNGVTFKVDGSPYNCHYGGLFIQFQGNPHSRISICRSTSNLKIYSQGTKIEILLVWYRKYSYGNISASVYVTQCITRYLEFGFDHSGPLNATLMCQRVICAPLVHSRQKSCTVRLGESTHSIGTSQLRVSLMTTSGFCIPEYHNSSKAYTSNFTATYTENWPMGGRRHSLMQENIQFEIHFEHVFEYLHFGSISLPPICYKNDTQAQIGFIFIVSVCQLVSGGHISVNPLANIQNVDLSCKDISFNVKANFNTSVFIYKESNTPQLGLSADVKFSTNCNTRCRNVNYTFEVWKKEERKIYEYAARVGEHIFTGYFHNG